MSTPITILSSGIQPNVATVYNGQTPELVGYKAGNLDIAQQKKSTPLDTSTFSTLRGLTLSLTSMTSEEPGSWGPTGPIRSFENGQPWAASLMVLIETGPTTSGPWTVLHTFKPMREPGAQRVPFNVSPDAYTRASWWYARTNSIADGINAKIQLTFGITADALAAA